MNIAPVALFTYCRPEHTRKVLQALCENEEAKESELFIFIDGPKDEANLELIEKINQVKAVCSEKQWCKKVEIINSPVNKGLAKSITEGVRRILNQYGKVIVLEDDIVTSKFFLQYMNDALTKYENHSEVVCISGYIYPIKEKLPETFFIKGADCWGWATWKRGWDIFEEDGIKLLNELENRNISYSFDFDGTYPYTKMLRDQIAGINNSWAINWYASAYLKNKLCLYPGQSLVKNIGLDGSGTHSGTNNNLGNKVAPKATIVTTLNPKENIIARNYIKQYFQNQLAKKTTKARLKEIIPNSFLQFYYRLRNPKEKKKYGWFGDYKNWDEAKKRCSGYDDATILEKVKTSVLKVKNGEAVYERDSVIFNKIEYSTPILETLQLITNENNGKLNVIDFGGSLGSSYFQYKPLLKNLKKLNWNVVEQPHFSKCGNDYIQENGLRFFNTIEEALNYSDNSVLLLSSVLQYLEKPYEFINSVLGMNFKYIILDRTAFIEGEKDRITIQIVPEEIYKASYPAWFFNEQKLIDSFSSIYLLLNQFECMFDPKELLGDKLTYRKGFSFRIKTL